MDIEIEINKLRKLREGLENDFLNSEDIIVLDTIYNNYQDHLNSLQERTEREGRYEEDQELLLEEIEGTKQFINDKYDEVYETVYSYK